MLLKISLLQKQITLSIINRDNVVDSSTWQEDNSLSQKLLPEIDALLKKNNLELKDLEKVEAECDLPEQYTSGRIVRTVTNTLNYSLTQK